MQCFSGSLSLVLAGILMLSLLVLARNPDKCPHSTLVAQPLAVLHGHSLAFVAATGM